MNAIIGNIVAGNHDAHLDAISNAIALRRSQLSEQKKSSLCVGDIVRFNNKTKPRYMIGHKAKVTKINQKRVQVTMLNGGVGRFGSTIITPLSIIDKCEA